MLSLYNAPLTPPSMGSLLRFPTRICLSSNPLTAAAPYSATPCLPLPPCSAFAAGFVTVRCWQRLTTATPCRGGLVGRALPSNTLPYPVTPCRQRLNPATLAAPAPLPAPSLASSSSLAACLFPPAGSPFSDWQRWCLLTAKTPTFTTTPLPACPACSGYTCTCLPLLFLDGTGWMVLLRLVTLRMPRLPQFVRRTRACRRAR